MNKVKRIIFLFTALLSASIISYSVYKKATPTIVTAMPVQKQEIANIAVALNEIKRGTVISPEHFRMASYLRESLPEGHFSTTENLVGRVVIQHINPTAPILESSLAPEDLTKGGMAAIITHQKRAMAVKVDDVIGVAGFLHPGHLVDVLVSVDKPGERNSQVTKTILENIPVLSIGTQAEETTEKTPKRVTVVTLEVDLEEGEKLALAVSQGKIQLALRGYSDTDQILTKGTSVANLLKSYATPTEKPVNVTKPAEAPPPKPTRVKKQLFVEMMNGNKMDRIAMDVN